MTGSARPAPSPTWGTCGWRRVITRPRPRPWSRPWASTATSVTGSARPAPSPAWGPCGWLTGDYPAAAQALEQALGIYRDLGDRLGQAGALTRLGAVRRMTGDYPAAAQALEQALGIYRDLGHRLGQAGALANLGAVRRLTGDYPAAAQALEQSLGIFRDLGTGVVRPRRSTRQGRCTGSAVTSRRLSSVTSRPWTWPALSPAPGTRLTRWLAWAAAPWPPATPRRPGSCCGRRWRSSSGSVQPRPQTCSPNWGQTR